MERNLGEFDEEFIREKARRQYEEEKADFKLDPTKMALIVIDMIEEFTKPKWTPFWVPESTKQLLKIKKVIEKCREKDIPVIYTYYDFRARDGSDLPPRLPDVPGGKGAERFVGKIFTGESVDEAIKPKQGDMLIRKFHYGAFTNTELSYVLKNLEKDTIIICGTMTNYCCGNTAREGYALGYKVIFGSDITSTDDPSIQEAEIKTLRKGYALILSSSEIIDLIS
jgi:nicotinamidase-related amidase